MKLVIICLALSTFVCAYLNYSIGPFLTKFHTWQVCLFGLLFLRNYSHLILKSSNIKVHFKSLMYIQNDAIQINAPEKLS